MRISLGDVSLWFDVSGPSVIPQGDTTAERPVVVAVHGGPGLDHMTVKGALGPLAEDYGEVQAPPVSAGLVRRLGNFPFWRGERPLVEAVEPVYLEASALGLSTFLGERKEKAE